MKPKMSEPTTHHYDVQIYQSSWDIEANKPGETTRFAQVFLKPEFKCPDGCELNARDLPITCTHGWTMKESLEARKAFE